jgi:hypothetical protein
VSKRTGQAGQSGGRPSAASRSYRPRQAWPVLCSGRGVRLTRRQQGTFSCHTYTRRLANNRHRCVSRAVLNFKPGRRRMSAACPLCVCSDLLSLEGDGSVFGLRGETHRCKLPSLTEPPSCRPRRKTGYFLNVLLRTSASRLHAMVL